MSGFIGCLSGGFPGLFPSSLPNAENAFSAEIQVQNDGDYLYGDGLGGAATTDWITPSDTTFAAYYQVKTDVVSGTFGVDPSAGSYLDCSTTRSWSKSAAGTVSFTMTFREKATGIVVKTYSLAIVVT